MLQEVMTHEAKALIAVHGTGAEAEAARLARDAQNAAESRKWDMVRQELLERHANLSG